MIKQHGFNPIFNSSSKVLILGTMPSIRSKEEGFYYMHPQNRFWKVLSNLYSIDFYNATKEDKIKLLLEHNIALFDIVLECEIELSKDSSISRVKTQDIEFILKNSSINKIILNGKKAYSIFMNAYPKLSNMAICAPSTSPANAKFSLEDLTKIWKELLI